MRHLHPQHGPRSAEQDDDLHGSAGAKQMKPFLCIGPTPNAPCLQVAAELYDTTHFGSGVGFLIMSM
jgi:hypothetical protein